MSETPALLERFRRGPEVLAMVLTGVFGEEEDFVTAPGKWSVRQIIAHLADVELMLATRFRFVIAEENPTLIAMNQDLWAKNLDYARRKPKQSLETFRRLRAENYELLKGTPEESFERQGTHTQRGVVTLRGLVEDYCGHTENHARQMVEIREAYKAVKGKK
jgi:hypothetical protein